MPKKEQDGKQAALVRVRTRCSDCIGDSFRTDRLEAKG
jgi:hypothetical protein